MGERELPEGWEWKRLGDVINYQKGKKPNLLEEAPHPTSLPYLSADFLRTAKSTQFIPENEWNSCIIANNQDILLIWDGSNSGEVFLGTEGIVSSTMVKLKPKTTNLLQQYLFYFLKTQFNILNDGTNGSSIPHVSKSLFENIRLLVPPLSIQRHIVAVLEQAEAVKRQRQEADALRGALLQSVFLEMFGDTERNDRGWDIVKIRDVTEKSQYGCSVLGTNEGQYPIIGMNNLTYEGKIDLKKLKYVNLSEKEFENFKLEYGDVLFNRTNAPNLVGKTGLFQNGENFVFASYLIRLKLKMDIVDPQYLWTFLNSPYMKNKFSGMCKKAVNQANINAQELQNISIPLPPLALQQQFARIVESVERIREQQVASGRQIEGLCEGLVQREFGGELSTGKA